MSKAEKIIEKTYSKELRSVPSNKKPVIDSDINFLIDIVKLVIKNPDQYNYKIHKNKLQISIPKKNKSKINTTDLITQLNHFFYRKRVGSQWLYFTFIYRRRSSEIRWSTSIYTDNDHSYHLKKKKKKKPKGNPTIQPSSGIDQKIYFANSSDSE